MLFVKPLAISAIFSLISTFSFAESPRTLKLASEDRNYEVEISLPVIINDRTGEDVGSNAQEGYALVSVKGKEVQIGKTVFLFSPLPKDALYTGFYNWKEAEGDSGAFMMVTSHEGKFSAELQLQERGRTEASFSLESAE